MTKQLLILTILLLPTFLFGQKKYVFKYRHNLTCQNSTFTTQKKDTLIEINKSYLTFHILDKKGDEISFANITIKNSKIDTVIRSDIKGNASIYLNSGSFSISIKALELTPIKIDSFEVKENTTQVIKTSLGHSNKLKNVIIYSIRKLNKEEIDKIIDDISMEREDNELIKSKTCYIVWEI